MTTAKIVRKFCEKTFTSYKRTLYEVRRLTPNQRGMRLKAMKEFLANKNIDVAKQVWDPERLKQEQTIVAGLPSI